MGPPVFRYDFNSPYAYLAAARVDEVLGPDTVWQPIAFAFVLAHHRRVPWSFDHHGERSTGVAERERRARERGLPPMAWPPGWPVGSYSLAPLRVALVADEHELLRAYSRAAFARNFVAGTGLQGEAPLEVAEEAGLSSAAVAAGMPAAKGRLKAVTEQAIDAGVRGVPTVTVGGQHFWGDDQLEAASRATSRPATA